MHLLYDIRSLPASSPLSPVLPQNPKVLLLTSTHVVALQSPGQEEKVRTFLPAQRDVTSFEVLLGELEEGLPGRREWIVTGVWECFKVKWELGSGIDGEGAERLEGLVRGVVKRWLNGEWSLEHQIRLWIFQRKCENMFCHEYRLRGVINIVPKN